MTGKKRIRLYCAALVSSFPFLVLISWTLMTTPCVAAENLQMEWERTLKEARKEGKVAVFGGSSVGGLKEAAPLFKDKFGIELDTLTAKGGELSTKLNRERSAGLYTQDVMITGHTTMLSVLKPAGVFDPLPPMLLIPEVVNQKLWYDGRFDWADTEGRYIFNFALYPYHMVAINTQLVKPGDIKSYYDLLNPKWKGKIIISDPTVSGMANTEFMVMLYNKMVNLDFFRRLASQGHMLTRDQELQVDWLARGKYPVVLWPSLGRLAKYSNAGAPVRVIDDIKEGTGAGSTGSALVLINKAPHPNAAKVFINWFLSKEGQTINQKIIAKQTRRLDVGLEGVSSFERRKLGVKYFASPGEREEFVLHEEKKYTGLAKELFTPLIK